MKSLLIRILQAIMGYRAYLYYFTRVNIFFLPWNSRRLYRWFLHETKPDQDLLVLGACTGITTIPFCRKIKGTVIAIEPEPSNFATLKRVVQHYHVQNALLLERAAGNENSSRFIDALVRRGRYVPGEAHVSAQRSAATVAEISVQRLDDMPELQGFHIGSIKLIAQGDEYRILQGARQLIEDHRPRIYSEIYDPEVRKQVLVFLAPYGYVPWHWTSEGPKEISKPHQPGSNLVFLPR